MECKQQCMCAATASHKRSTRHLVADTRQRSTGERATERHTHLRRTPRAMSGAEAAPAAPAAAADGAAAPSGAAASDPARVVSDEELVARLHAVLATADLETTTERAIRRQLEEELGVELTERKALIREQARCRTRAREQAARAECQRVARSLGGVASERVRAPELRRVGGAGDGVPHEHARGGARGGRKVRPAPLFVTTDGRSEAPRELLVFMCFGAAAPRRDGAASRATTRRCHATDASPACARRRSGAKKRSKGFPSQACGRPRCCRRAAPASTLAAPPRRARNMLPARTRHAQRSPRVPRLRAGSAARVTLAPCACASSRLTLLASHARRCFRRPWRRSWARPRRAATRWCPLCGSTSRRTASTCVALRRSDVLPWLARGALTAAGPGARAQNGKKIRCDDTLRVRLAFVARMPPRR